MAASSVIKARCCLGITKRGVLSCVGLLVVTDNAAIGDCFSHSSARQPDNDVSCTWLEAVAFFSFFLISYLY